MNLFSCHRYEKEENQRHEANARLGMEKNAAREREWDRPANENC